MDRIGDVGDRPESSRRGTLTKIIDGIRREQLNPTHFLLCMFSFSQNVSKSDAGRARKRLFDIINNQEYVRVLGDDDRIFIKWQSKNYTTAAIYYTTSRFEEQYIRQLTKALMREAFQRLLTDLALTEHDVQLNYLTSKNMEFEINVESGRAEFLGYTNGLTTPLSLDFDSGQFIDEEDEEEVERVKELPKKGPFRKPCVGAKRGRE